MFMRNVLLTVGAIFVLAGVALMVMWFGRTEKTPPAVVETRPPRRRFWWPNIQFLSANRCRTKISLRRT
jgi:hypothetical protein